MGIPITTKNAIILRNEPTHIRNYVNIKVYNPIQCFIFCAIHYAKTWFISTTLHVKNKMHEINYYNGIIHH